MLIVGVTGGIGSGKSFASEFLRRRGAAVIDADEISRELMRPRAGVLEDVVAAFGPEVLRGDGSLDRRKLAGIVFGDAEAVARLNAITHPAIMAEIGRRVRDLAAEGKTGVACVVAPLLLEAGGRSTVDRVMVVVADEDERVRRVMARDGLTENEVRARMAAQMAASEQVHGADWVIDTTAGRGAACRQLEAACEELGL